MVATRGTQLVYIVLIKEIAMYIRTWYTYAWNAHMVQLVLIYGTDGTDGMHYMAAIGYTIYTWYGWYICCMYHICV